MLDSVADRLLIPRGAHGRDLSVEQRDIHDIDAILESDELVDRSLARFERERTGMYFLGGDDAAKAQFMGRPKKLFVIKGMGTVWDYRGFTIPNGGTIKPLFHVEHIPVIRQMSGRADLDVLWRVLVQQGLMVHNGTDGEGNVALYLPENRLAYHARGANSLSAGTEHMHLTTADKWSNRQLNASAYLSFRSFHYMGLTTTRGVLGAGPGYVTVRRRGHGTHEDVSNLAGFHDRTDPGEKYEGLMAEVAERAQFYNKHRRF